MTGTMGGVVLAPASGAVQHTQDARALCLEACPFGASAPAPVHSQPVSLFSVRSRVCCLLRSLDSTREILQCLSLSDSLGTVTSKSTHCAPQGRCPSF